MRLSLGPVSFLWQKKTLLEFCAAMLGTPVDTIYLGEVVCLHRQKMRSANWVSLAEGLVESGKEIILSSQVLLENESDLKRLRRTTGQNRLKVEANDMDAVRLTREHGIPFVTDASLSIYSENTLALLQKLDACRWIAPSELSRDKVAEITRVSDDIETELFAWGRMPLAYSSRCFTARHYNLDKDGCEFRCLGYEQGMDMNTREDKPFLTINGIQTMSCGCQNLLPRHEDLRRISTNMLRLSSQIHGIAEIIRLHRDVLGGKAAWTGVRPELEKLAADTLVDGYWRGRPGTEAVKGGCYDVAWNRIAEVDGQNRRETAWQAAAFHTGVGVERHIEKRAAAC